MLYQLMSMPLTIRKRSRDGTRWEEMPGSARLKKYSPRRRISSGCSASALETGSGIGESCRVSRRATIKLAEGAELILGEQELDLGHLDGRVNILGAMSFNDTHPVLNRKKAEWIVRQPAGASVTISASTAKAGTASVTIALE